MMKRFEKSNSSLLAVPVESADRIETEQQVEKPDSGSFRIAMIAVVLCAVAAFGLGFDYLLQPQMFPMRYIEIHGDIRNAEPNRIRKAIAEVSPSNMLRIDIAKAAEAAEALPWIAYATIRRQWPDTLDVKVKEHVIRARWGQGQWLDEMGIPVSLPDYENDELPWLRGPQGASQDMLAKYKTWSSVLDEKGLEIRELKKSGRGSWEMYARPSARDAQADNENQADQEIHVLLGSSEPLAQLRRFAWLYEEVFGPLSERLATVDLRYPDGVSIRWTKGVPRMNGSTKIKNS